MYKIKKASQFKSKYILKSQSGFLHHAIPLLIVAFVAIGGVAYLVASHENKNQINAVPVSATFPNAAYMAAELWMIKVNDLKTIGGIGSYEWVTCGITTAPLTPSNYTPCQPGQVPTYTSEETFASDVANHKVAPGSTVLYDNEPWKYTPDTDKDNPALYEQKFAQLAAANGIKVIGAPYSNAPGAIVNRDLDAARAGDSVVEIQAQFLDRAPSNYVGFVTKTAAKIHAINPNTIVLAGLATDDGGVPVSASEMYQEWKGVKNNVQGFWLNANTWTTHIHGCSASGCPAIAQQFLQMIGI